MSGIPTQRPRPKAPLTVGLRKPASSTSLKSPGIKPSTSTSTTATKPTTATPRKVSPSGLGSTTTTTPGGGPSRTLRPAQSSSSLSASNSSSSAPRTPARNLNSSSTLRATSTTTRTTRPSASKSPSKSPTKLPRTQPAEPIEPPPKLSLKETIALKRAEAKKQQVLRKGSSATLGAGGGDVFDTGNDDEWNEGKGKPDADPDDDDALGRRGIRETIERARESGNLNLCSRELSYLPPSLFTIHLGIDPPLVEGQPEPSAEEIRPARQLAYYEGQDLTTLRLRDNAIAVVTPEISLFGSLKVLDFSKNKLSSLPDSFGDLVCLVHLDLSENAFATWPGIITYLPLLAALDVSKNGMTELKLALPDDATNPLLARARRGERGATILPALKTFSLAGNKLTADGIDTSTFPPRAVAKLDLSSNPLGKATKIVDALAPNKYLRELSLRNTELEEGTFVPPVDFKGEEEGDVPFMYLQALDVSENGWIKESEVREYFPAARKVTFVSQGDVTPRPGVVGVRIGLKDTREAWEIEADARAKAKSGGAPSNLKVEDQPEGLGIGEDRFGKPVFGGGRKRMDPVEKKLDEGEQQQKEKEPAEEELVTEAARLRKRMREQEEEEAKVKAEEEAALAASGGPVKKGPTLDKYYDLNARTLELPASKRQVHQRHASLVFNKQNAGAADPNVPTETLPFTIIAAQSWADTLRSLHLSNRRADPAFVFDRGVRLEKVEDVLLDGCGLGDTVRVKNGSGGEETKEAIFELLGEMFPSLATLDLSENGVTRTDGIVKLFFPETHGRGLKVLRLKGNAIENISGLVEVAERFGRGESDGWRGEEIDIRDNQIPKLPPVLGLLQLDVLLVEGNAFRVPPRMVWQREGTQGLLKYLRESAG